jgi:TolB-like protein/DNA-binding winged helix-turn-helix (wHTH) protein/Tfp pilus assembly protein PilF
MPRVCFGAFEADLASGDLRKHGLRVKLRGRPFDVLCALIEQPGELVTREALRERLWAADTFVDFDHGLNAAVNKLREALGDAADNPRFIETVPRRGYRFIAPVSPLVVPAPVTIAPAEPSPVLPPAPAEPDPPPPATAKRSRWWIWPAAAVLLAGAAVWTVRLTAGRAPARGPQRVAVLPFRNLSGDPSQEYFVDGMTEALIAELAQVSSLRVISRTSVTPYKTTQKTLRQIASELGVDVVLEGSAIRSADKVRVTAQLIEASSDQHLWARTYDCDLGDVLDMQRRVAREATAEIRAAVTADETARLSRSSPVDPRAHDAYLRGMFLRGRLTEEGLLKSIEYFDEAVRIDPDYADAYAGLADSWRMLGAAGWELRPPRETAPKARAAAERALAIDPDHAAAASILALVRFEHDWDWPGAEAGLRRVIGQQPGFSRGHLRYSGFLTAMTRFDEAQREARLAKDLDPLSAIAGQTLAIRYYYGDRCDLAEPEFRKALELEPSSFVARLGLGQCAWREGRVKEALPDFERAVADSQGSTYVLGWLGFAYAQAGDGARARGVLARLEHPADGRYAPRFPPALVCLGLGDRAGALDRLESAFRERSAWMAFLRAEPELAALADEPRFRELDRRVGLPAARP